MRAGKSTVCLAILPAMALFAGPAGAAESKPSLDYVEFGVAMYRERPTHAVPGDDWQGLSGRLELAVSVNDYSYLRFEGQRTEAETEPSGSLKFLDENYEAGIGFAAPVGESTRIAVETGWTREWFNTAAADAGFLPPASSDDGLYAAIGLRTMLGDHVEIGLRSGGYRMFDVRRRVHEAGIRFFMGESVALGLDYELLSRDFRERSRTGLSLRFDF